MNKVLKNRLFSLAWRVGTMVAATGIGFAVSQGMYGRMVEAAMKMNAEETGQKAPYKSGHWEEPNILAHIRMNDRTDADGAKVLFIEEAQSDWGQEGKRRGFLDGNKARYEAEYRDYADELMAKYGVSPTSAGGKDIQNIYDYTYVLGDLKIGIETQIKVQR